MRNNMESPSPDSSSDTEEPGWVPSSSPSQAGRDTAAPGDAASAPLAGEDFQGRPEERGVPSLRDPLWEEESCAKPSPSSARRFLKNLWKVVGSPHFQSIWWADNGNCIAIAEQLFCKEVLGRKIFATRSMGGFILQLSLHGFHAMEGDSPISISVEELQGIAAAGSSLGKVSKFLPQERTLETLCGLGKPYASLLPHTENPGALTTYKSSIPTFCSV
ncbi:uncharacterized protein LOC128852059 [Cuculus canorus]|uniref:uncharacterized protein LOC128852059 n=1 Tax=Cuculus canorus TaxID=55661 RepID=UPI0023AA661F|nr:uncharacterized protein LOC128852059 [Cuculus canorus]